MAALTLSVTSDTVLGTLDNGMKVVSSVMTFDANTGAHATGYTVTPLKTIVTFFPTFHTNTANMVGVIFTAGNQTNQIGINPVAACNGAIVEIISFGY